MIKMEGETIQVQEQKVDQKYLIRHDRPNCIGCAACNAVAPNSWVMNPDGKSDVVGGKDMPDKYQELEIDEKDFRCNKDAAESCPVNVIHLIDKTTGKQII